MRCSTRILLVTAFAIFAGLGLLAASTRTVAREVAPRSPAAQISSSEDDNDEAWDWPSLLSPAPPSSPTPCPSAPAADAAAGLVAERRAACPAGCPNASSALYASLASWDEKAAAMTDQIFAAELAVYKKWVADGEQGAKRRAPRDSRTSNHRPGNLFNGVLHPIIGYGIRGAIWYQGESNAGRAYQYRSLFPLMINTWREHWQQGDFPFYWVQLADFKQEALEQIGRASCRERV